MVQMCFEQAPIHLAEKCPNSLGLLANGVPLCTRKPARITFTDLGTLTGYHLRLQMLMRQEQGVSRGTPADTEDTLVRSVSTGITRETSFGQLPSETVDNLI